MSSHDRITEFDVQLAIKASKEARIFTEEGFEGRNTFKNPTYPPLIEYKEKLEKMRRDKADVSESNEST